MLHVNPSSTSSTHHSYWLASLAAIPTQSLNRFLLLASLVAFSSLSLSLSLSLSRRRLQLTASLHLSTVRLLEAAGEEDEDRTKELLREEVETARRRLGELMEAIEEDKEEIREATLL